MLRKCFGKDLNEGTFFGIVNRSLGDRFSKVLKFDKSSKLFILSKGRNSKRKGKKERSIIRLTELYQAVLRNEKAISRLGKKEGIFKESFQTEESSEITQQRVKQEESIF